MSILARLVIDFVIKINFNKIFPERNIKIYHTILLSSYPDFRLLILKCGH